MLVSDFLEERLSCDKRQASGDGLEERRALGDGPAEHRASGGGLAKRRASDSGPEECQASGGGPVECRASGGGPEERRALGDGPAKRQVSGYGLAERRDLGGGPAERRASGGGSAERRALDGGPAERRASGGGPAERRASGGGPVEHRASGGDPAECRASGGGLAVVWQHSGVGWWSGGGSAELRRWSRRSKRSNRILGASRSKTHQSRNQSVNHGREVSASFYPGGQHAAGEGTSGPSLEERIQKMEESQKEILQLLREARQAALVTQEEVLLPQDPPLPEGVQFEHLHEESPLPLPRRHPQSRQDNKLADTASSTHPSHTSQQPRIPPDLPEDLAQPHESSPLTETILQHPIPNGFKLPSIEAYDGTSDPYEHIDHYRTIMHIQRASDALLCQVFPATLKGQARTWFYSLPAGTILTFVKLTKVFVEQFVANWRIIKDFSHLSGIRQNEGESLKEYFQRFSTEARQISGVDPELLRGVYMGGLCPGPFYSALMRDTILSYADLIHRVEAQISADEAINAHRKQFEQTNGKRKGAPGVDSSFSQRKKQGKDNLPPKLPQEKEYTPLNVPRANVLMAIRDQDNVKWPNPLNPNTGNQNQYCHFHRSQGHTTEACKQLKDEIERLIRQGYL
ncbi:hypothetical protein M5K25_008497 [Dendrobium thyrsiflorum]|uniref:Retrotransposon gag domain-containing protein n=1 Tax=Dendrobium thyrsiflorum TaxID=117978 RepID=A0ABD0VA13_DENTH